MVMVDLTKPMTQADFGELVGMSQQAVSDLVRSGHLPDGAPVGSWLRSYCGRLRAVAAGRESNGDLNLAQERAGLAREHRIAAARKNAVARKQFAPIALLSEVLAAASQSVGAKLDALPNTLRKIAPELSDDALLTITAAIARARNEWVADTGQLALRVEDDQVDGADDDDELLDLDEEGS